MRSIADILRDLDSAAAIGLDMSPGDELCAEAAAAIRSLIGGTDRAFQRLSAEAHTLYESIMDAANENDCL